MKIRLEKTSTERFYRSDAINIRDAYNKNSSDLEKTILSYVYTVNIKGGYKNNRPEIWSEMFILMRKMHPDIYPRIDMEYIKQKGNDRIFQYGHVYVIKMILTI